MFILFNQQGIGAPEHVPAAVLEHPGRHGGGTAAEEVRGGHRDDQRRAVGAHQVRDGDSRRDGPGGDGRKGLRAG